MTTRRQISLFLAATGLGALGGVDAVALEKSAPRRLAKSGDRAQEMLLDGVWQAGRDRRYDRELVVPGLASDPAKPTDGALWYKRTVILPAGAWTRATLTLMGARFAPEVYVDGEKVSASEGGMAATHHRFALPNAGGAFTLEIALRSLNELDPKDASAVPGADQWRSNVSSYLWDSVFLRLHGQEEIVRIVPRSDLASDSLSLRWQLAAPPPSGAAIRFSVLDGQGKTLIDGGAVPIASAQGVTELKLLGRMLPWSPEAPHLYRLRAELIVNDAVSDVREQSLAQRQFGVEGLGFKLNGKPYRIRMGTIVWHRWTRDPEARLIAFDSDWFERNVVLRLKEMGANALRFHLGLPPDAFLDLCDRHGLAVQLEWPFFHGVEASEASMSVQWMSWLDAAARHPSVVILHPWNETGGDQLKAAWNALNPLLKRHPPIVVSHRELTPVHKYWWSLFENLGLYYDSASQFGQAVMVDEFGGNYLDGAGDPGKYPTTREAFLRFLGRGNTRDERLQLQADANGRVAEYWRRLGVAGFSPFTILGSQEDGNHWFMGPSNVRSPRPKPVWAALAAAFAQRSLSLEIWNRNFSPGETVRIPLWFFNDTDRATALAATVHVVDARTGRDATAPVRVATPLKAQDSRALQVAVPMPARPGAWRLEARLAGVKSKSVVSSWGVHTVTPQLPIQLRNVPIGVPLEELELRAMLTAQGASVVSPEHPNARVVVGGRATWARLTDETFRQALDARFRGGVSIVLLDAGPQPLGVGYRSDEHLGGPLEGAPTVSNPALLQQLALFGGVSVSFIEAAEPESALQPPVDGQALWQGLSRSSTWLWNGLRGGLIVPAADMRVMGLSGEALLSIWQTRGADPEQIRQGEYFAYELAGYYAFAKRKDDRAVAEQLRERVKFLVADAPALAGVVNPQAPIEVSDLHGLYRQGQSGGQAKTLSPLANAGKNLTRSPVVKLTFGPGAGTLVISQLLMAGRLREGRAEAGPGVYGLRYDPAAVQLALNMIDAAL